MTKRGMGDDGTLPQTDPLIGTRIGPYELQAVIGRGGMGSVYRAWHKVIGRQVAIKVIHPELNQRPEFMERFFNEARAANTIGHEHIVDIHDVGQLPSGMAYCIMELLVGEPLSQLKRRMVRLEPELAIHIVCQVAAALDASHSKGIVHRDLKPENVFLVERGGDEHFVKVLDFGIAKLLYDNKSATQTGQVMGSPYYMAPEQCRGASNVDHRADIYSLAAILYELCTGTRVFSGEGSGDLMIKHATQPPDPPRQRNPMLPEWLEKVILHGLEKDREARFPSMEHLAAALQRRQPNPLEPSAPRLQPRTSAPTAATAETATGTREPSHTSLTTFSSIASEVQRPRPRRRTAMTLTWVTLGLLVIAAGAAAVWRFAPRGTGEPTSEATVETKAQSPAPAAAAAKPAPPPPLPAPANAPAPAAAVAEPAGSPGSARLQLTVVPASAEVRLDGAELTNPFEGSFARNSIRRHLQISAPGYRDHTVWITFEQDRTLAIELKKARGRAVRSDGPQRPREAIPRRPAPSEEGPASKRAKIKLDKAYPP